MNKTSLVIAVFVAAVLAGLFVRFNTSFAREPFMQKEVGMPLNASGIGPYDGVSIGGGISGWSSTESAPMASAAPPSQSITSDLMLLVDNKVSSECCPSAFNTDTGCVCLTEHDKSLFATRGGNRA